jgi:hypothetical protein
MRARPFDVVVSDLRSLKSQVVAKAVSGSQRSASPDIGLHTEQTRRI